MRWLRSFTALSFSFLENLVIFFSRFVQILLQVFGLFDNEGCGRLREDWSSMFKKDGFWSNISCVLGLGIFEKMKSKMSGWWHKKI